jgi:hypothetical protein
MSPEFTILAEIDLTTSRSEKPEGEIMNDLEVRMPDLISKLSSLRIYVLDALNNTKCKRLNSQSTKNNNPVHQITGTTTTVSATSKNNSSHDTTTTITRIRVLLATALGRIHGLAVQSTEREAPEESCDMLKT